MGLATKPKRVREKEKQLSRQQMIAEHLPHVKRIVHRIAVHLPPTVDNEDLINAGIIGLIEAVERYDPTRDNKFMTYALFRIRGAVLSELGSRDYLSKNNRRKIRELEMTAIALEQKLGREVNDEEVAEALELDLEKYYQIKKMSSLSFVSLEEMGFVPKKDNESLMGYLIDGDTEDAFSMARIKEVEGSIAEAIEQLPEREKIVISLYYWDELTMKEIGKVLDVTESRVSQVHSQAIGHLRRKLINLDLTEETL